MKTIQLTKGKEATVDDEHFEWLTAMGSWCLNQGYAVRNVRLPNGKRRFVHMHRLLMDAPDGTYVDHRNNDPLDNRRENLRLCTNAENQRNRGAASNSRSGLKGVSWHRQGAKWQAQIEVNGRKIHLGLFQNYADASQAYDQAAIKHHGEFAQTNNLDPYGWSSTQFMRLVFATSKRR